MSIGGPCFFIAVKNGLHLWVDLEMNIMKAARGEVPFCLVQFFAKTEITVRFKFDFNFFQFDLGFFN